MHIALVRGRDVSMFQSVFIETSLVNMFVLCANCVPDASAKCLGVVFCGSSTGDE